MRAIRVLALIAVVLTFAWPNHAAMVYYDTGTSEAVSIVALVNGHGTSILNDPETEFAAEVTHTDLVAEPPLASYFDTPLSVIGSTVQQLSTDRLSAQDTPMPMVDVSSAPLKLLLLPDLFAGEMYVYDDTSRDTQPAFSAGDSVELLAVPEPSSMAFLLTGLVSLAISSRRRR
jgi:hypothetical protein